MRKIYLLWALLLMTFCASAQNVYDRIFITEYLESGGTQKAIEIGNFTSGSIRLDRIRISTYFNGITPAGNTLIPTLADDGVTNVIPSQKTFVIYNANSSVTTATINADYPNTNTSNRLRQSGGVVSFSGNDAIKIEYKDDLGNWVTADIFGKIGENPGTSWSNGGLQTEDRSLSRKPTIFKGVQSNPQTFNISDQWVANYNNTIPVSPFTTLGQHVINLPFYTSRVKVFNVQTPKVGGGPPYTTTASILTTVLDSTPRRAPLSQYGGALEKSVGNASGFFTTRKDPVTGVWNFVDPDGYLFYSVGVNAIKNQTPITGISTAVAIRDSLRCNTLGAYSEDLQINSGAAKVPYMHVISFITAYVYPPTQRKRTWDEGRVYPIFEPAWPIFCDSLMKARVPSTYINDKFLIGYFSDNEITAFFNGMLDRYADSTKYPVNKSNDVNYKYIMTWLAGRHADHIATPITDADRAAFTGLFADRYFSGVRDAIKNNDPNHLFLGSKFTDNGITDTLLYSTTGKYCDVISVDYYRNWSPDTSTVNMWYNKGKKPFIIAEFGAKGQDVGSNYNNYLEGASFVVPTQQNRGDFLENFVTNLMKIKSCIGFQWYTYKEYPVPGTNPTIYSNKGIIDNNLNFYLPVKNSFVKLANDNYNLRDWQLGYKIDQKIDFAPIADKTIGDAAFVLPVTASSGLNVSYTSTNPAVATVSGNTVTILAAGKTTIIASQNGDGKYNPADTISQDLVVRKKIQTIVFNALPDKTFGNNTFSVNATSNSPATFVYSSSNTQVATISGNTVTIIGAGTTDITALNDGGTTYLRDSVIQHLNVNKADQIITFSSLQPKFLLANDYNTGAAINSPLPINYETTNSSVAVVTGGMIKLVGPGSTTITAKQDGNANYNAASSVAQTLVVTADTVINVVADAYVRDFTYANTNFGSDPALVIKNYIDVATPKTGFYREAYLRFDLSSLAHNGGSITSANLKLTFSTANASVTLKAFAVNNDTWSESGITYNNKPTYGSTAESSATATTPFNMNLTNYMNTELASSNHLASLCLKDDAVNHNLLVQFSSKEDPTSTKWPVLAVTVSKQVMQGFSAAVPSGQNLADSPYSNMTATQNNNDIAGIISTLTQLQTFLT